MRLPVTGNKLSRTAGRLIVRGFCTGCVSAVERSAKLASRNNTNECPSPSQPDHRLGVSFPWSCQRQFGVRTKSPAS